MRSRQAGCESSDEVFSSHRMSGQSSNKSPCSNGWRMRPAAMSSPKRPLTSLCKTPSPASSSATPRSIYDRNASSSSASSSVASGGSVRSTSINAIPRHPSGHDRSDSSAGKLFGYRPWQRGESSTAVYWCLYTMAAVGPDDQLVHPHDCCCGAPVSTATSKVDRSPCVRLPARRR
jgi:hypothetical protein